MNVLQPVIALTSQKDISSLEKCFLSSIPRLIPVNSVSLYKPVIEHKFDKIEERKNIPTSLIPTPEAISVRKVIPGKGMLLDCLCNRNIVEAVNNKGVTNLYIPIVTASKSIMAIRIESCTLDQLQRQTLNAFIKIYQNHYNVLHDSERDQLTSLLNRRTFENKYEQLVESQKVRQKLTAENPFNPERRFLAESDQPHLGIIDIDHFKKINDQYGHTFGDEILLLVTELMRSTFRSSDLLFRFGGEEFLILLEPCTTDFAFLTLERYRKKVENHIFPQIKDITVSIGLTVVNPYNNSVEVIGQADKALYFAKDNGRNSTYNYSDLILQGHITDSVRNNSIEMFNDSASIQ